jgi:hypothetical protein
VKRLSKREMAVVFRILGLRLRIMSREEVGQ